MKYNFIYIKAFSVLYATVPTWESQQIYIELINEFLLISRSYNVYCAYVVCVCVFCF